MSKNNTILQSGWGEKALNDFLIPTANPVPKPEFPYRALGIRSHGKGTFQKFVKDPAKVMMDTLYCVMPDELIVNITFAWEGAIAIVKKEDAEHLVSHRFPTFKFNKSLVIPEFFKYYILQKSFIYKLGVISPGGAGRNRVLSKKDFLKISAILPPLPEQKKIASILTTVDDKISSIEHQIHQTEQLKNGLMEKLLTEGIGNTEFKKTKIGRIPKGWGVETIESINCIVDYRGKTPPKSDNGVFLVTARNIKGGKINYSLSQEFIPKEIYDEVMKRGTPKIGDVLITTEAPMGEVATIDNESVALAQRVIKLRGKQGVLLNVFQKHYLASRQFQKRLDLESTGSTVKGIKGSRLKKMLISVPPIDEQKQIATILSTVDDKIEVLTQKKTQYQTLKKGLSQQLLTGQMRVKI